MEEELNAMRDEAVIKDSMILEYQQALTGAHFKIASLNGQLKLKQRQIDRLTESSEPQPTG